MTDSSLRVTKGVIFSLLLLGAASCSDDSGARPSSDGPVVVPDAAAPPPDARPRDSGPAPDLGPKSVQCTPPACPACVAGKTGCAQKGPYLPGTCCARGDSLAVVGSGLGVEKLLGAGGKTPLNLLVQPATMKILRRWEGAVPKDFADQIEQELKKLGR